MRKTLLTAVVALTPMTQAAVITFDVIEAAFYNAQGGDVTLLDPVFPNTSTSTKVRWGDQATMADALIKDSGYDFTPRATSFSETVGDTFELGTFTHLNRVIDSASLAVDTVDLRIKADFSLSIDNQVYNYTNKEFKFRFTHDETTNNLSTCPYDESDGLAVPTSNINGNGCSDLVTVTAITGTFIDPIANLTLNLEGFADGISNAQNGIFETAFISGEKRNNSAILTASFSAPRLIPEPATLSILMLGFFAGAALIRARRSSNC